MLFVVEHENAAHIDCICTKHGDVRTKAHDDTRRKVRNTIPDTQIHQGPCTHKKLLKRTKNIPPESEIQQERRDAREDGQEIIEVFCKAGTTRRSHHPQAQNRINRGRDRHVPHEHSCPPRSMQTDLRWRRHYWPNEDSTRGEQTAHLQESTRRPLLPQQGHKSR